MNRIRIEYASDTPEVTVTLVVETAEPLPDPAYNAFAEARSAVERLAEFLAAPEEPA